MDGGGPNSTRMAGHRYKGGKGSGPTASDREALLLRGSPYHRDPNYLVGAHVQSHATSIGGMDTARLDGASELFLTMYIYHFSPASAWI